jgi:peptide/nickel transport system substrate-binding protein
MAAHIRLSGARGVRSTAVVVLAGWLVLLAGCGEGGVAVPTAADPGQPRRGGTLTIAVQDDAHSLDPHQVTDAASMRMSENLYSTLMRYGEAYGEIEPDLAEAVDISDDGLTYTLRLRANAVFHSGRVVTSDDVIYSIERIRDAGVRADHFRDVQSMQATDERTVVLQLSAPSAPLLTHLAYPMNAIVDRLVVEANGGRIDRVAAGSGPFRLVEWRADQRLVLERNDDYYVAAPHLDRVIFRPIPDETARTTALRNAEIDLILDVAAKDVEILQRARGVRVARVPGTFWEYVGFNTSRPPFDDVRVRQAIALAVDRATTNQLVKLGQATPLVGGHIPHHHWAYAGLSTYAEPDVARARDLLSQAGHGEGFTTTLKVGSAFPYQVQAAAVVKDQLRAIGVDVEVRALESTIFFADLGAGDFDMTLVGWVGFVDPDDWLWNIFHSEGKYNQQQYASAALDELLEQGRRTLDRDARRAIYTEAQEIIATEAPMVFLYLNDQISAHRDHVHGYVVHPTQTTLFLRQTWVTK